MFRWLSYGSIGIEALSSIGVAFRETSAAAGLLDVGIVAAATLIPASCMIAHHLVRAMSWPATEDML